MLPRSSDAIPVPPPGSTDCANLKTPLSVVHEKPSPLPEAASDLCRVIGQAACNARVREVIRQFGCPKLTATLAVHDQA